MADTFLPYQNPGSTDSKLDCEGPITVGANSVVRERVQISGAAATDLAPVSSTNGLAVEIKALPNEGQQTMANSISVAIASNQATYPVTCAGDIAHDSPDSGNPTKVGYKAIAHGSNPTAVAAADRTDAYSNRHGIPWVIGGHPNIVTFEAAYTTAQTDTAIITVSSGTKIVVTQIQVTADGANTVEVGFRVGFGTANTPTTTGVVATHPGVIPGTIFNRGDGSGILGVGADNEDLRVTSEVPTTGSIRVLVSYYTIES